MTAKADAGDIVAQEKVTIEDTDTSLILHEKSGEAAAKLMAHTLPHLASGNYSTTAQR